MNNTTDTKQKYCIEIADVQLTILSDESEEFVKDTVKTLDARIRDLTVRNKRCAKIDAAILCALDSLGEKLKLEKKVKNLEAQIDLYEANLRRHRGDALAPAQTAEEKPAEIPAEPVKEEPPKPAETPIPAEAPAAEKPAEAEPKKNPKEEEKPKEEAKPKKMPPKPVAQQLTMEEIVPAEPAAEKAEPAPAAEAAEVQAPEAPDTPKEEKPTGVRDDKLRQIESLLRRRSESSEDPAAAPAADGRDDKLRQIEELLRVGGGRSLTEALQGALDD